MRHCGRYCLCTMIDLYIVSALTKLDTQFGSRNERFQKQIHLRSWILTASIEMNLGVPRLDD